MASLHGITHGNSSRHNKDVEHRNKDVRYLSPPSLELSLPPTGIANPGPLGLLCFGMTTLMLMFITTTWAEGSFLTEQIAYVCFFGGFGQMVAGVLELVKGNTFAGTAFFSYGAFWVGFFLTQYMQLHAGLLTAAAAAPAKVGGTLFMCLWGVFTVGMFVPTLRKNKCLMTIFSTLAITFFLLAGGQWNADVNKAAGYVGFVCGCSAIYTAFAEVYSETFGRIMPGLAPVRYL